MDAVQVNNAVPASRKGEFLLTTDTDAILPF